MRNILIALVFLTFGFVNSQVLDPVKWTTSVEKISDTEYNLIATANIDAGWHLYSQIVPEGGPIATTFIYDNSEENFTLNGNTVEKEGHIIQDPVFEMEIKYFDGEAKFVQNVTVSKETATISGFVEFMVCDDTRCLPPTEVDLEFQLSEKTDIATKTKSDVTPTTTVDKITNTTGDSSSNKGLWSIFFIAFLSGFAALLTPCVFPMIPMTVSFFTKQSKNKAAGIKNAIIYGICIIVIYLLLGIAVTGIFGADALNALATNVWFNIIFFILLVVFAVSFLGAFEIMLPNSWANKVDSQADRGGLVGIFFMALALAIVSFSCTGPIVGT